MGAAGNSKPVMPSGAPKKPSQATTVPPGSISAPVPAKPAPVIQLKLPVSEYLSSVIQVFIEYISDADRAKAVIPRANGDETYPGTGTPTEQRGFLERYVCHQLDSIAAFE